MMTGLGFYNDRSRFSWWQVEMFMLTGPNFYDDMIMMAIFMITLPEDGRRISRIVAYLNILAHDV